MSSKIPVEQYMNNPEDSLTVSLVKLTGKKIKDLEGYIGDPFIGGPVLSLHRVVFEDGTAMFFEGEHDLAYVYPYHNGAKFLVDLDDLYDFEEIE